jgi:hypothetical protein
MLQPSLIVMDFYWVLIYAVIEAFNKMSLISYLSCTFEILKGKATEIEITSMTFDALCCAHMVKTISRQPVRCESRKKVRQTVLVMFARLQRCSGLATLARACDRHQVSDRAAAAISSAVLQDFGVITQEETSSVIDRSKVRRARQAKRHPDRTEVVEVMWSGVENSNELPSLDKRTTVADGRKDSTITIMKHGSRWYKRKVMEEHLSLVEEPGSKYIGHVAPL